MKKLLIITTLFPLIFGCKIEINKEKEKKPNIIVILVDDAGYFDFGFTGSKDLETPNLDKLAANGVILSDAHVTATVCAPSRAGLITSAVAINGMNRATDNNVADNWRKIRILKTPSKTLII